MSILDEIFATKREEVEASRSRVPLEEARRAAEAAPAPLDFAGALRASERRPALIAEVKRASPSRGVLVPDFDHLRLARIYQENGAAAISVLTDERYFKGSLQYLREIACLPGRPPLLRKDFLCDPYQVYEARAAGADAVLLIAAHLEPAALADMHGLVRELSMSALVEVHSREELDAALRCDPEIIGINNRDLRDFTVRTATTFDLRPLIPAGVRVVSESGIHTPEDAVLLGTAGVDAVLIGEALVTAQDIAEKVRSFTR